MRFVTETALRLVSFKTVPSTEQQFRRVGVVVSSSWQQLSVHPRRDGAPMTGSRLWVVVVSSAQFYASVEWPLGHRRKRAKYRSHYTRCAHCDSIFSFDNGLILNFALRSKILREWLFSAHHTVFGEVVENSCTRRTISCTRERHYFEPRLNHAKCRVNFKFCLRQDSFFSDFVVHLKNIFLFVTRRGLEWITTQILFFLHLGFSHKNIQFFFF